MQVKGVEAPHLVLHKDMGINLLDFLQSQLVYARQAQDMTAMTTDDNNGWLPLHRALKDNVPLGSIKLLVIGNPGALNVADRKGAYTIHIACKFSSVKVVKYLVDLDRDSMNNVDAKNNSQLHYACQGGSLDVAKYLLEANVPSVSEGSFRFICFSSAERICVIRIVWNVLKQFVSCF